VSTRPVHVLVMAKAPIPGRVKTRLLPYCDPEEAAAVAAAALADTVAAVAGCGADHKVVALDGPVGDWLAPGVDVHAQRGGALDERLANAWADTRARTGGWGVQIAMDTPQVTSADLDSLLAVLTTARGPAVLGPATDGGWWAIGLPGTDPGLVFRGVPMSTAHTGEAQARRLRSLGLDVIAAPRQRDIDTIDDLFAVAATIPWSRTAAVARSLGESRAAAS
jgi:glycosyltransferase A (GT-A) superfamily protein (DUF2064 family)